MPWISDRDWQKMQQALVDGVHRRGDRREQRTAYALAQLEKEVMLTREEMRAKLNEAVTASRDASGRVNSMQILLTETLKKVKELSESAGDLEEFREGLDEVININKSEAQEAIAAVDANPGNPGT